MASRALWLLLCLYLVRELCAGVVQPNTSSIGECHELCIRRHCSAGKVVLCASVHCRQPVGGGNQFGGWSLACAAPQGHCSIVAAGSQWRLRGGGSACSSLLLNGCRDEGEKARVFVCVCEDGHRLKWGEVAGHETYLESKPKARLCEDAARERLAPLAPTSAPAMLGAARAEKRGNGDGGFSQSKAVAEGCVYSLTGRTFRGVR